MAKKKKNHPTSRGVTRTRREEKLRLPPPPPAPPPLRVRASPPLCPSIALPPPPLRCSCPRRLQRHHPLGELDLQQRLQLGQLHIIFSSAHVSPPPPPVGVPVDPVLADLQDSILVAAACGTESSCYSWLWIET